jgi:hypothetical protein
MTTVKYIGAIGRPVRMSARGKFEAVETPTSSICGLDLHCCLYLLVGLILKKYE